jgi:transcriptional regulator GlxA family with amidase domain
MPIRGACRFTRAELNSLDSAIAFVKDYYYKPLTAADLGDQFGLNVRKLQAGFKRRAGATVHEYILNLRLENAKSLLSDPDEPIKAVANKIGFKSHSHFGQAFKDRFGITPHKYKTDNPAFQNEMPQEITTQLLTSETRPLHESKT